MIRKIGLEDRQKYIDMVETFYQSDAVFKPIPRKHIEDTFDELMNSDTYASAYIIEWEGNVAGYALMAKTFSQEAGGMVLWIEELYIKPEYRRNGLGKEFFAFLEKVTEGKYSRLRLEVEDYNKAAVELYHKKGFSELPYMQMIRDRDMEES